MKFIVSSSHLLKELSAIAGVLNTSNTLPILDNFLFSIKKGDLTVSASDLESTIFTKIKLDKSDKEIRQSFTTYEIRKMYTPSSCERTTNVRQKHMSTFCAIGSNFTHLK